VEVLKEFSPLSRRSFCSVFVFKEEVARVGELHRACGYPLPRTSLALMKRLSLALLLFSLSSADYASIKSPQTFLSAPFSQAFPFLPLNSKFPCS